jgi:opacity protein-like surface antigen
VRKRCYQQTAAALFCASLALAGRVAAQATGPQFGLELSRTEPVRDFRAAARGEGFIGAWQAGGLLAFRLPKLPVGFRIDAGYGTNGANDSLKAALAGNLGAGTKATTRLLGGNLDLTASVSSKSRVKPYVLGGVGLYRVTISVETGDAKTDDTSGNQFAWNAGGGIRFRLKRVALFVEARYIDVTAVSGFPRTTFLPITAGIWFGER